VAYELLGLFKDFFKCEYKSWRFVWTRRRMEKIYRYNLQKAAHKLNQIITEYGLIISVQKTKSMAFKG